MNKTISYLCLAAVLAAGCAKAVSQGPNDANKKFFDAWLSVNKKDAERAGRGIYIESTVNGDSQLKVSADGYVILSYVIRDLYGNISSYTDEETARQMGTYSPETYYGPRVLTTTAETIRAGVWDGINGLSVGSKRTFIIPSWLMSYENFASEEEYLASESEYESSIYEIKVEGYTNDINNWQFSQIARTIAQDDFYDGLFMGVSVEDSTSYGLYYKDIARVAAKEEFPSDTTVYVNYTGSLLNGLVFDTTVEKVAKDNNLYSESNTYEPAAISWAESYSEITLGGNSVVSGFAQILWKMADCAPGTKAVGVFYSGLGYGYSDNGNIPAYSPLVFEVELVEKP